MPFENQAISLTLPEGAGPGEARLVITSEIPQELQDFTFLDRFNATVELTGVIVFYNGSPNDQTYLFMTWGLGSGGNNLMLYIGKVEFGAVADTPFSGFSRPEGMTIDASEFSATIFTWLGGSITGGNALIIENDNSSFGRLIRFRGKDGEMFYLRGRGDASFIKANHLVSMVQIGEENHPGNYITAAASRLTPVARGTEGSDGIQWRVEDGGGVFWTALRSDTSAQLRAVRQQWVTTGSAANVRIFTGDSGLDARIGLSTSSARFKRNIEPVEIDSEAVMALRPVRFKDTSDPSENAPWHIGLVAEEVQQILPLAVDLDENGEPFSIDYQKVNTALLSVVQQQQRQIDKLAERVAALERA